MPTLRFTKMHGLGNDFVVIDAISESVTLTTEQIRHIAHRRFGVGCDQILLAEPPRRDDADVRYRIYNADGSEVEHCGNGVRCLARFLVDKRLIAGNHKLRVETVNGLSVVELLDDGRVAVNMGEPILEPAAIPFRAAAAADQYSLNVAGQTIAIGAVSMGNPHAVAIVEDVDTAPVATLGPAIESHEDFPNRVNAGFMQIVTSDHVKLRVYERGAGETMACGTGACAAVVSGRLRGHLDASTKVDLPGGRLVIDWERRGEPVWMTGPAVTVFEGQMTL